VRLSTRRRRERPSGPCRGGGGAGVVGSGSHQA